MSGFPAAATSVGNQSSPEKMPFSTDPALTCPGQRMMAGTRKPPSKLVPLVPLNGVIPPSGQVNTSAPLSIVIFTTDNGAEVFTWPDGGMTPFKGTKGTSFDGGFRVPAIIRWPGHVKAGSIENGIFSGLDWFPTLLAAAGNSDITNQLLKGAKLGDRTYKNHLDGYNQMDLLECRGPSARHELFYFSGAQLGALRLDDFKFQFLQQPYGWPGEKLTTDMPAIVNIRQDPFERTPTLRGET